MENTDYPFEIAPASGRETIVLPPSPEAWANMNAEVERLNTFIENQRSAIARYANDQSEFESRLTEAIENDEIDGDLAKEFADIFGLELSKEYTISITATWSGTVTVPFGQSIDDLDISANYPEVSYSCDDFELDVNEDEIDWDVQENF